MMSFSVLDGLRFVLPLNARIIFSIISAKSQDNRLRQEKNAGIE